MNLSWSEEDEGFRRELRGFLAEHSLGKPRRDKEGRLDWQRRWQATLVDHGWGGPSWPRAFGGMDLPFSRQVIYQEEVARAHVPGPPGTGVQIAGPAIIRYGTEDQQRRFLRPMLRADVIWAQGFSEPDAGSDLPALKTTAVRDGDKYIVNGQKVWSSSADIADMLFTLVRTGPSDSRQEGISYLMIDLHGPGVTVRPIRDLAGASSFSEVFLDEVVVPAEDRIGEENDGWTVTRTSLGHERAAGALNQAAMYRRVVDELLSLAKERGVTTDPVVRQRLAAIESRTRIMGLNAMRTISDIIRLGEPGPASSISRLFNSTFEQDLHTLAVDLIGPAGMLDPSDAAAVQKGRWTYGFLRTRASTIGAGTAEIQRNTIAERVLGLPHEAAMP